MTVNIAERGRFHVLRPRPAPWRRLPTARCLMVQDSMASPMRCTRKAFVRPGVPGRLPATITTTSAGSRLGQGTASGDGTGRRTRPGAGTGCRAARRARVHRADRCAVPPAAGDRPLRHGGGAAWLRRARRAHQRHLRTGACRPRLTRRPRRRDGDARCLHPRALTPAMAASRSRGPSPRTAAAARCPGRHDRDRAAACRTRQQAHYLTRADLAGADLTGANLGGARLTGADLTAARLTGASLADTDLTGADLTRADLSRVELTGALWPQGWPVPAGWTRHAGSGQLVPADAGAPAARLSPVPGAPVRCSWLPGTRLRTIGSAA